MLAPATATGQQQEFEAAWTDFKTQFGTKALPFFTGILKTGSAILRAIPDMTGGGWLSKIESHMPGGNMLMAGINAVSSFVSGGSSSPYVAQNKGGNVSLSGTMVVDGKVMGKINAKQQNFMASQPETGISGFDSSMNLSPVGAVY
jgi:hypothetical protein